MPVRRTAARLFFVLLLALAPFAVAESVRNGKIAFSSNRDGNREIYVMNPDGTEVTRLTNDPAEDREPAWSPNGAKIAFTRAGQIHVMRADGTGVTQLTTECCLNQAPAWSPDGRQIVFQSKREDPRPEGRFELFRMAADGTNVVRLTNRDGEDVSPSWSPDGTEIVFACWGIDGFFRKQICAIDADGSNFRLLTEPSYFWWDGDPSYSPDGTTITFTRDFSQRDDVMVMNADGSNPHRLWASSSNEDVSGPVFSPDGAKIAAEMALDIHVMNADGSDVVQLTQNGLVHDIEPSWQPIVPFETTGLYFPSTGQWLLFEENAEGTAADSVTFGGQAGDLPVAGDWDADGLTDVAIYRNGTFVRGLLNTTTACTICAILPFPEAFDSFAFGQPGDLPVAGDWNGDGRDDVGVFRPGEQGTFLLRVPSVVCLCPTCPPRLIVTTQTFVLGTAGDLPVAGDWDGDGKDDVGTFNPTTATFILSTDEAKPTLAFVFGAPGDRPLAGNWLGGAGPDGIGVFQPSTTTMLLASEVTAPPDFFFSVDTLAEGMPVAGRWKR